MLDIWIATCYLFVRKLFLVETATPPPAPLSLTKVARRISAENSGHAVT